MLPARIAELLEPFLTSANSQRLTPNVLQNISTYIDILQRWNARVNLTAIRDSEEIVTRHFGESLFAARHLFPACVGADASSAPAEQSSAAATSDVGRATTHLHERVDNRGRAALPGPRHGEQEMGALAPEVADIGSGAGFPGIPIKLWAPHIHLTLIESNHKKATFLKEVTRALTLTDVNIQTARAESLAPATFATVTLRAVERFESILPVAARLVTPGGRLALLIGDAQLSRATSTLPTFAWSPPHALPSALSRVLLIGRRSQTNVPIM
ncbi:MAG TPA: 16S rRNA (guanine(527)-N(7))-methyltransferase RsmG [Candidatus Dormibacteraeota bacterium]|nr:16S rRNA (guanine(527)-N(7))-methyltransferase RsmG [Candidatus Dormibacteraeota bacterium]